MAREHVVVVTKMGECRHIGHDDFITRHLFRHSLWNLWLHEVVDVGHHSSDEQHTAQSSILLDGSSLPYLGYGKADWDITRILILN